ncbi:MAG: PHP domain-containing protein [Ruminococcus sp.]|nr:PHP domain-containing protein [Ruminococcus sp.]
MKIIADLHTHTVASTHAYSTVRENCEIAAERGLSIIAMTDHAPLMADGPHEWHAENQQVLPQKIKGIYALRGIEADIMNADGELDIKPRILDTLQWVVASFHSSVYPTATDDEHLQAIENVCKNPLVDMFGHLTITDHMFDYTEGAKLLARYDKIAEVNESSIKAGRSTRKNAIGFFKACKKENVRISLDSDAHYCESIGELSICREIVKEVGYPEELIINTDFDYIINRVNNNHPKAQKIII